MNRKLLSARILLITPLIISSCDNQEISTTVDKNAVFNSFSTNGQTLPSFIHAADNEVTLEISHEADVTRLIPEFETPAGYSVYADGIKQVSGNSMVDFSQSVNYELKDSNGRSTAWNVSAIPLGCKILIDASHDGGVWWFPQYEGTGFNSSQPHQGLSFANLLREKGFEVTELGRGVGLTEEMFFGYYIVIRAGGFQAYTTRELEVYTNLINRGMNLVFFTDHKKNDPVDELGDLLGLKFKGSAIGTITTLVPHEITANIESIDYIAGSVLMNANENPNVQVLGWLGKDYFADLNFNDIQEADEPTGAPVMGILTYPKSRIFFMGDMNGLQIQPQPFIDNLIQWMGQCF